jgi:hypothetical protein
MTYVTDFLAQQSGVHAITSKGDIMRLENGAWTTLANSGAGFIAAEEYSATEILAAAQDGNVYLWDGDGFHVLETGQDARLWDLWSDGTNIVALNEDGHVLRSRGHSWTVPVQAGYDYALWGTSPSDIYGAGAIGLIYHFDGSNWSYVQKAQTTIYDLAGVPGLEILAVGGAGLVTSNTTGVFAYQDPISEAAFYGAWLAADASVAVAVGEAGTVFRRLGGTWAQEAVPTQADLSGVWGTRADNLYAVSASGEILHFDGSEWQILELLPGSLNAVWGYGEEFVAVVGELGLIAHFDGTEWQQSQETTTQTLRAIHGTSASDVFAAGEAAVVHFDGTRWDPVRTSGYRFMEVLAFPEVVQFADEDAQHTRIVRRTPW